MSDETETDKADETVEVAGSGKPKSPRNMTPVYMLTIAIVFLAIGFVARGAMTGGIIADASPQDAAATKAVSFINSNLLQTGQTASVTSVNESNGMYLVSLSINGQNAGSIYVSKDGNYLILGSVLDMNKPLPKPSNEPAASAEIPKSDKPVVELFVMSFCPYGVQVEQVMAPVVSLLGDRADFMIRFIGSIGDTLDSVQSLHGSVEGKEDIRQLCVAKNYDTPTYWKYLSYINTNCYPMYRGGEAAYDACWKSAAQNASIDVSKIESCIASEGVSLMKAESAAADSYGVSGSPTLVINGLQYNSARTSEAYKTAICDAFNTPPAECGQTLSATGGASPTGGCGG